MALKAIKRIGGALYRAKMRLKGVRSLRKPAKLMKQNRNMWKEARARALWPSQNKDFAFLNKFIHRNARERQTQRYANAIRILGYRMGD